MASNFKFSGDQLTHTLGSGETAVKSGKPYLLGSMVGVVLNVHRNGQTVFSDAASASGDVIELAFEGVFTLTKASSGAITKGARVYWDNTNAVVTTTATDNIFMGFAAAAAADGATSVDVLLHLSEGPDTES